MHNFLVAALVGSASLAGISELSSTPLGPQTVHIAGSGSPPIAARVARLPIVPSTHFGSPPTASDIVVAVDGHNVHFRYGLVWETPRRQFLAASVAAWAEHDPSPGYSFVSGRTATSTRNGVRSFVLPLPGPDHGTIQVHVDVMKNGSAVVDPSSLRIGTASPCC
jgi:hypothetical protein